MKLKLKLKLKMELKMELKMKKICAVTLATFMILLTSITVPAEVPADAVWIDVRSAQEYAGGHLDGAVSIPFDGIEVGVAAMKLGKDTPIYLYCAVGGRAEIAKQRLQAQNFSQVINVGGLEDARKLTAKQPADS